MPKPITKRVSLWWRKSHCVVGGIDEVGRGPLAGPVVVAAVALPARLRIKGLRDSKKLSDRQRRELAPVIRERALAYEIVAADVHEIAQFNILQATLRAMDRAVAGLLRQAEAQQWLPDLLVVDGNHVPNFRLPAVAVVGGDDRVAAVSAASVLAKVYRDDLMCELENEHPGYGFAEHKGYATAAHRKALQMLGPTPAHRLSFLGFLAAAAQLSLFEENRS